MRVAHSLRTQNTTARSLKTMKTYNVGILGFGFIGKVHAYGYLNLPFFYDPVPLRARVTHVATSRPETAEKAKATIGADVAATDYRAITEDPAIDIVHICTPNHLHRDALLSAIGNQKHIYCDKPLVATLAEAEQIEAALADYRGTSQMTFQYRFYPSSSLILPHGICMRPQATATSKKTTPQARTNPTRSSR